MESIKGSWSPDEAQRHADDVQLTALGYKPQLSRVLGLFSNFAVGFAQLSPVVGVYSLFAFGLGAGGPAFIWGIPLVVAGQALVVLVFSEVGSQYPVAGGIYQWTKYLVGRRFAWMSGWFYIWALLATIASVAFAAAIFVGPLFGFAVTSTSTIVTAVAMIALAALINLSGVRNLALIAKLGVVAEVGGTFVIGVILLVGQRNHGFGSLFHSAGAGAGGTYAAAFLTALLFSLWIFYGFETCGDVAEEVIDPSRRVPRAMQLTLAVSAFVSLFITLALILAVPNFGAVISGKDANPIATVLHGALGAGGEKVALVMVLIAFVSCTLSAQAAATRLIFGYARDRMIIGSGPLSKVSERFHLPPVAVAVSAVIPAAICFMPSATVARVIAFAVIGMYVALQSVVLAALVARVRGWKPAGAFRVGRLGMPVTVAALLYGIGAIVVVAIKTPALGTGFFDKWLVPLSAVIVAVVGIVYLILLRPEGVFGPERSELTPQMEADGGGANALEANVDDRSGLVRR